MSIQPPSLTISGLINHYAAIAGHREAVVSGASRLTYAQLRDEAARAARGLQLLGVCSGQKVALLMGNRAEWVVSAVAVSALGATVVALNTWWTAREIEYAVDHSEARFLICSAAYVKRNYAHDIESLKAEGRLKDLQVVVGIGDDLPTRWVPWLALLGDVSAPTLPTLAQEKDVAYILYTSGSTSAPKGVQLIQSDLVENTWHIGERQGLTADDRLWLAVSLFWGFGCSNAMPAILSHGGCIVLQESFDAGIALELMERERCSVLYGTPNMIQAIAEHPDRSKRNLQHLRTGATLGSPEQLRRAAQLAPSICNVYGLTEIYGNCHSTSANDPLDLRMKSSGRPIDGVEQRIVDVESGRVLGPGEVGEIRVKGRVTPAYLNDPMQTKAAFDADGYFRTGDLGTVDADGNLQFRGRLKEMVKTGGINVSPAEIEAVLMTLPGVEYALVVGIPDATRDEILGAVVIPHSGCTPTEEELRSHCKRLLANYKIPAHFHFTTADTLPLTTTGKVQKNRLAQIYFGTPA